MCGRKSKHFRTAVASVITAHAHWLTRMVTLGENSTAPDQVLDLEIEILLDSFGLEVTKIWEMSSLSNVRFVVP